MVSYCTWLLICSFLVWRARGYWPFALSPHASARLHCQNSIVVVIVVMSWSLPLLDTRALSVSVVECIFVVVVVFRQLFVLFFLTMVF